MNVKCKLGLHKYKCIESILLRQKDNRDLVGEIRVSFKCQKCGYIKKEIKKFSVPTFIKN